MKQIIILTSILFFFSCKEKVSNSFESTQPIKKEASQQLQLPSITIEVMDTMYGMVDYIDFSWNEMNFSSSMEDKEDIKGVMQLISTTPQISIPSYCKPIGRQFFNIKGITYLSADIYFSNPCKFYVFLDGEQKKYANLMTQDAITYYNAFLSKAGKPLVQ